MSNQIKLASKLFILIAVLLFAWVGISCKNKNTPGEEGGMDLKKPNDVTNKVGDNDGFMNDDELNKAQWRDEMIQIRLLAVSEDGGYYRNPVIATFGSSNHRNGKKIRTKWRTRCCGRRKLQSRFDLSI